MRTVHVAICLKMDAVAGPSTGSRLLRTHPGFELPPQSSSSSSTPIRPRKRLRKPDLWKRNVAKAKRAKGEAYVSGQVVEAAKPGPPCLCKRRCFSKFTEEERKKIFFGFWGFGDKSVQDAYLHGLIRVRKVARRRPRAAQSSRSPRETSFVYVVCFQREERERMREREREREGERGKEGERGREGGRGREREREREREGMRERD